MTSNNVLGCEIVLMTAEVVRLGGKHVEAGAMISLAHQRIGGLLAL